MGGGRAGNKATHLCAGEARITKPLHEGPDGIAVGIGRLLAGAGPGIVADPIGMPDADHGGRAAKIVACHVELSRAIGRAASSGDKCGSPRHMPFSTDRKSTRLNSSN